MQGPAGSLHSHPWALHVWRRGHVWGSSSIGEAVREGGEGRAAGAGRDSAGARLGASPGSEEQGCLWGSCWVLP